MILTTPFMSDDNMVKMKTIHILNCNVLDMLRQGIVLKRNCKSYAVYHLVL